MAAIFQNRFVSVYNNGVKKYVQLRYGLVII